MDALVENGTVVQAIVFDTVCSVDIVDNQALMNASVEVCTAVVCMCACARWIAYGAESVLFLTL